MNQPTDAEVITVYPKLRILVGYVFACLLLLAAGVATFLESFDVTAHPTFAARVVGALFGGSLTALPALLLPLLILHLIRPRPILSITDAGIGGSGALVGRKVFVAWHEITGVRRSGTDIVIDLKNPDYFMKRAGWAYRIAMRINRSFYGTPAVFSTMLVPTPSPQMLAETIENRWALAVMK